MESRTGAVNISTTPLTSTFTRGGLRCNRVTFDLDNGQTHEVVWIVGGPLGCVTFMLLEIQPVIPELSALTTRYINGKQYMAMDLGRHIIAVRAKDDDPDYQGPCLFLDGLPCNYSGSGMNAMFLLSQAVEADSEDVIWNNLIELYHDWIEDSEYLKGHSAMQRRWRVHWKGPSAQSIERGFPLTGDDSHHYRSFVDKEHAEAWKLKVEGTRNCYDVHMEDRLPQVAQDFNIIALEAVANGNVPAVLEIDRNRGVLYVHSMMNGRTAVRICGLKKPVPDGPIDISLQTLIGSDVTDGYTISYAVTTEWNSHAAEPRDEQ